MKTSRSIAVALISAAVFTVLLAVLIVGCVQESKREETFSLRDSLRVLSERIVECESIADSMATVSRELSASAIRLSDSIIALTKTLSSVRPSSTSTSSLLASEGAPNQAKFTESSRKEWNKFIEKIVVRLRAAIRQEKRFSACRNTVEFRSEESRLKSAASEELMEARSLIADLRAEGYSRCDEIAMRIGQFESAYDIHVTYSSMYWNSILNLGSASLEIENLMNETANEAGLHLQAISGLMLER